MTNNLSTTEKLFSYGTLRYEAVQLSTFGRKLTGQADVLAGYRLSMIPINDPSVVEKSGDAEHPIIQFTGNPQDQVAGFVFDVSKEELKQADTYEVAEYTSPVCRMAVILDSEGNAVTLHQLKN